MFRCWILTSIAGLLIDCWIIWLRFRVCWLLKEILFVFSIFLYFTIRILNNKKLRSRRFTFFDIRWIFFMKMFFHNLIIDFIFSNYFIIILCCIKIYLYLTLSLLNNFIKRFNIFLIKTRRSSSNRMITFLLLWESLIQGLQFSLYGVETFLVIDMHWWTLMPNNFLFLLVSYQLMPHFFWWILWLSTWLFRKAELLLRNTR